MTENHIWDRAWKMVLDRTSTAETMFVYAVRTTGIYCRPSCPSRRPLRKWVEFYPTSELAERAGYRACKRCTPAREHPQLRIMTAACNYLDRHDDETIKLKQLGEAVGLSPFHVQRIFRRCLGITPREYQHARRLDHFRRQAAEGDTVTTALYQAGFGSSSRFYASANRQLGMTPAALRDGGRGMQIRYSINDSPLDKMLVATTDVGICAISFGLLESELEDDLAARFPLASLHRDRAGLASVVQRVLSQLSEHPVALDLPLDVRATAFQKRVWTSLQQIPRGETRSYSEIARSLARATAVRAVARACSQNPVAVLIPCHRVVGANGKLTGYRWGVQRKQELLSLENNANFVGQPRK